MMPTREPILIPIKGNHARSWTRSTVCIYLRIQSRHYSDVTFTTSTLPLRQYPAHGCVRYPKLAPSSELSVPCWLSFTNLFESPCMTLFDSPLWTGFDSPFTNWFNSLCLTWFDSRFLTWFDSIFPIQFDSRLINFPWFKSHDSIQIPVKLQGAPHWPGCLQNNPTLKSWNIPRWWELRLILARTL